MLKREMPPVHPGTILKEMYLDPLEIGVGALADNIGVVRRTISLLVNEHSGVSAEMALRLSKTFGTTPQFWLNMQQTYDLWYAEKKVALKSIKSLSPVKSGTKIAAASKVTNLSVAKPMGNRPF
jgi:addiction module HigA family antidote